MAGCTCTGVLWALFKVFLAWIGRTLQILAITGAASAGKVYDPQDMASVAMKYCEVEDVIRSVPTLLGISVALFAALILSNVFIGYRTHGWAGGLWALLAIEPLVYAVKGDAEENDIMELTYSAAAAIIWNGGQAILSLYTLLEVFASRCAANMTTEDVFYQYWQQIASVLGSFILIGYYAAFLQLYVTKEHSLVALDDPTEAYNASFCHVALEAVFVELPLALPLACTAAANGLAYTLAAVLTRRSRVLTAFVLGRLVLEWLMLQLFLGSCWHNLWKAATSVLTAAPWLSPSHTDRKGRAVTCYIFSLVISLGLGLALGGLVVAGYQVETLIDGDVYFFPGDPGVGEILLGLTLAPVALLPVGLFFRYCCACRGGGGGGHASVEMKFYGVRP